MTIRLLVLAPHPDDEILGCMALMTRVHKEGGAVKVVVVTDGSLGGDAASRKKETTSGLASIGLSGAEHWAYTDGELPMDSSICERYIQLTQAFKPTHLAVPSPKEVHPDHQRLTRGVLNALTGKWAGWLFFYETTTPLTQCNHFEPLDLSAKIEAMKQHASQHVHFNYIQWITGLGALRGASAGCDAAEGYLIYDWDGSPQNFFDQQPLVSVIVRSDDEALLAHALKSIELQTYPHTEVWVIWHGGSTLPLLPPSLFAQILRGPGGRSENLNMGLTHACGEYIAFLDQDDVWKPKFLEYLITELESDCQLDLAYSNYEHVFCTRKNTSIYIQKIQLIESESFQSVRLFLGNYIPIHSYVCRTNRAKYIQFDEHLLAYEDWDFLLRSEADGWKFRHVNFTGCEYRFFPETDDPNDFRALHTKKGYPEWGSAIRNKIFNNLNIKKFNTLLNLAAETHAQLGEAKRQIEAAQTLQADTTATLEHIHSQQREAREWADHLTPNTIGLDPISRLIGRACHNGPVISVLMPVCDPDIGFFTEAVHSVIQQTYPNWELCLADDASTSATALAAMNHLASTDPRIRLVTHSHRRGIVAATMSAYSAASGSWVTFVDHDDRLQPTALLSLVKVIRDDPTVQAIYTDSDTVDKNGRRINTFHKPTWSPETLLHLSYMNHLSAVSRGMFEQIGGLTPGSDGCQDWDMWLRLSTQPGLNVACIRESLYDWRACESSTAYSLASKPYVIEAAVRTTQAHLQRLGIPVIKSYFPTDGGPGIRHEWHSTQQPMTVIVLTHRNPVDLERLLQSLQASTYSNLFIKVVANRISPQDSHTQRLLNGVSAWPNAQVVHDDRAFNWAALNNEAARNCTTPWLLFLNDDVEWSDIDTLERLTRYLMLDKGIGVIGPQLLYGEEEGGGIQHDGIETAPNPRSAAHNIRSPEQTAGLNMPRNVSAVTGAFMLTTREVFQRCGGFDERFAVSFNDVDYCLHVRQLGYRILQASDVSAVHHESRTRGFPDTVEKQEEIWAAGQRLCDRWGDLLIERYSLVYEREFISSHIVHIPQASDREGLVHELTGI